MICIACGGRTQVINSRTKPKKSITWRRRCCVTCRRVFTTHETPLADMRLKVRYDDGSWSYFILGRLCISIYHGFTHDTKKGADASLALAETVMEALAAKDCTAQVNEIVEATYTTLDRFDRLAALQYAAQHALLT